MSLVYDVVIIGAGHNGLVCGAYLAKAGLKVCALERRAVIGGAVVTEELWPGFKVSTASFVMSMMQPRIIRELELKKFGLKAVSPGPSFAPIPGGLGMVIYPDVQKTCEEFARFSPHDAKAYPAYRRHMEAMAPFLQRLLWEVPINPVSGKLGDILDTLKFVWRFRDIGDRFYDIYELLTLSAYDFLRRWFESDEVIAAFGSYAAGSAGNISAKSPGSAYVLMRTFLRGNEVADTGWGFVNGGMGAITAAIAKSGERFGLHIRTDAEVAEIRVSDGLATGVVLTSGEEIRSKIVISNANAQTTFLKLVDNKVLPPNFKRAITTMRRDSTAFKINLAAAQTPQYTAFMKRNLDFDYPGTVRIGHSIEYLERAFDAAKYGAIAPHPYLSITVPTLCDPSLAPPGKHLISIFGGHAPYRLAGREWDDSAREELYQNVINTIAEHAPGFGNSVIHRQILAPPDLERIFDLPGGHVHHGDLSLNQIFFKRPAAGYANYRSPVRSLYQCGASTHPGGGVTGVPGYNAARVVLSDWKH